MEKNEIIWTLTPERFAALIDHTNLKADAKSSDIEKLCAEAVQYGFKSVCVNPSFVPLCRKILSGSRVKVCTVIAFPLGANSASDKANQAFLAVKEGADEVDMVINIGAVKDKNWTQIREEISAVREAVNKISEKTVLKVILETCYLEKDEIIKCCSIAVDSGADFVKTSTGFGTGGASKENVALMRETVGNNFGIKASGGIRTVNDALDMIDAGADRIGASASVKILEEFKHVLI